MPAATTAAGLARRLSPEQVSGIETGWAAVVTTWWAKLSQAQRDRLRERVRIDIDATDIEVHASKKEATGFSYARGPVRAGAPGDLGRGQDHPGR